MEINYEEVNRKFIEQGGNIVDLASIGFITSDVQICNYHALNILNRIKEVEDSLDDIQKENVITMYNQLIVLQ